MKKQTKQFDVVVCGGGLAGFCAAVSAARDGANTCLVHNRPVLGGNSSSEIGVTPHGAAAFHAYARETGILSELLIEERANNHAEIYENGWTNSVWDMTMYDLAQNTPNLTLYLNTDVVDVVMDQSIPSQEQEATAKLGYSLRPSSYNGAQGKIEAILANVQNAELQLRLEGKVFVDCTGDSLVADIAGCEWRMGSESKSEFGEYHAPDEASMDTMGNSIHFRCRDMGRPVPYKAPDWAKKYDDASFFYEQGRIPKEKRGGYWWLEIGVPYHTIYDNETIRHELTRHTLGVWDWMKNHDPKMKDQVANYALDWIGQVPGKRESRRVIGHTFVNENDILEKRAFEDEIAFGGWFVDLHTPGGLLAPTAEPSSADGAYDTFREYSAKSYCGPYGIPLSCLIAKDVSNLMLAGRNISSTHAALGTIRVMSTTALLGQACGTAAALSIQKGEALTDITSGESIKQVQQTLIREGCFLPNIATEDAEDLAQSAAISVSSQDKLVGVGPDSPSWHDGLKIWKDQPQYDIQKLETRRGQLIAIGKEGIESISVCLNNASDQEQQVEALIYAVDHIWDYRVVSLEPIATTTLTVPVGPNGNWVEWAVSIPCKEPLIPGQFLRLDLLPNKEIKWKAASAIIPGHMATYQIGEDQMRRFSNGITLSFKVSPAQSVYSPESVTNGVTRPHRQPNLWRSDASEIDDSWLALQWEEKKTIRTIELTFPGHLVREYHAYGPFYQDAQCVSDYSILCHEADGSWKELAFVEGNYQRRCIHRLDEAVETDRLNIVLHKTHGDPVQSIYEVRCYEA